MDRIRNESSPSVDKAGLSLPEHESLDESIEEDFSIEYRHGWLFTSSKAKRFRRDAIKAHLRDEEEQQLFEEVLRDLDKRGFLYANLNCVENKDTRERTTVGVKLTYFRPPRYKTPFDFFRSSSYQPNKEQVMAESEQKPLEETTILSLDFEEYVDKSLNILTAQFDELDAVIKRAKTAEEEQADILSRMESLQRALEAYHGKAIRVPEAPKAPKQSIDEALESAARDLIPRDRLTPEAAEKKPVVAPGKKRQNLTPAEVVERDRLQRVILLSAQEEPNPGEITAPEAAQVAGVQYQSKGNKKFVMSDAIYELVYDGLLEKTEELAWPNPSRRKPDRVGGRPAILYKLTEKGYQSLKELERTGVRTRESESKEGDRS